MPLVPPLSAFDRYVGLPWVDKGRGFAGVDCWGLCVLVHRLERGVELPSYAERYVTAADEADIRALIAGEIGAWREVAAGEEQAFDCLLMRGAHVGVVVEPGRVLHVREGRHSVIERYRGGFMRSHVVGFYRTCG